jgi:hypothetical protein
LRWRPLWRSGGRCTRRPWRRRRWSRGWRRWRVGGGTRAVRGRHGYGDRDRHGGAVARWGRRRGAVGSHGTVSAMGKHGVRLEEKKS